MAARSSISDSTNFITFTKIANLHWDHSMLQRLHTDINARHEMKEHNETDTSATQKNNTKHERE